MKTIISVAIDGPAGVGKSTVSKILAKKLGWNCLDTGALYRAFTVKCLEAGIDFENYKEIEDITDKIKIDVQYIDGVQNVFANGENVTGKIREQIIDKKVSYISQVGKVRESIKDLQREIATANNVVCEGRDIGSVVLVDTINKFFLTASPETRAERRFKERVQKGENPVFEEILADIQFRDRLDSGREVSPLKIMPDANVIDTSNLTIEQVVQAMYEKVKFAEQVLGK